MNRDDSSQGLFRVMRPTPKETPKSLIDKGFQPFKPSGPSSYRPSHNNQSNSIDSYILSGAENGAGRPRTGGAGKDQRRAQVRVLAENLSRITNCPVMDRGAFGGKWGELLQLYSFEELFIITSEAWEHRGALLKWPYRTFTVFQVDHYAKRMYKSHIPPKHSLGPVKIEQLIIASRRNDGTIDVPALRRAVLLSRMQRHQSSDVVLLEFGIEPEEVYEM